MKHLSIVFSIGLLTILLYQGSLAQAPTLLISGDNQFMHIEDFVPDPMVEGNYLLLGKFLPLSLYLDSNPMPYQVPGGDLNLMDFSIVLDFDGRPVFIKVDYVDSAVWEDTKAINSKHLSMEESDHRLLLLIKMGTHTTLYKERRKELLPPTYNESLQIGNKNYTLESSEKFFIHTVEGSLLEISRNLKSFKGKTYFPNLKRWVKSESLDLKKDQSVLRLADYVDQLEAE